MPFHMSNFLSLLTPLFALLWTSKSNSLPPTKTNVSPRPPRTNSYLLSYKPHHTSQSPARLYSVIIQKIKKITDWKHHVLPQQQNTTSDNTSTLSEAATSWTNWPLLEIFSLLFAKRCNVLCPTHCNNHKTLHYMFNFCSVFLNQGRYIGRHNSVLQHLVLTLGSAYSSVNSPPQIFSDLLGHLSSSNSTIPSQILLTSCPDLVLLFLNRKKPTSSN